MARIPLRWPLIQAALTALFLTACQETPNLSQNPEGEGSAAAAASGGGQPGTAANSGHEDPSAPSWAGTEAILLTPEELFAIGLETAEAELRPLASRLSAMGRVLEDQYRKAIVSYPFSARIAQIDARVGDWVTAGQTLVVLQSEEVGVAVSEFYMAHADHELAKVNFERESQLLENGVGARKNFSSAEAGLRVAEATLDAAEKKLHVLGFTENEIQLLNETHQISPIIPLVAPIAGKVITNTAVLGGMVDESTEILTILDPTHLWVEAAVYEKDIASIREGLRVEVSVPAYPDDTFQGTITYISDVLDPETRTITVRTEVANVALKLKPGMFAHVEIELNHNGEALSVPREAVLDDGGLSMVFVRTGTQQFEPRLIRLGTRENGFVEVAEGLEVGEIVVTQGNFQLKSKLYEELLSSAHVH